jgi:hypothetical protein
MLDVQRMKTVQTHLSLLRVIPFINPTCCIPPRSPFLTSLTEAKEDVEQCENAVQLSMHRHHFHW